jgi:hypothetical protein
MAVVEERPADGNCAGAENLHDWQREPPEHERQHVPERERKAEELERPVALDFLDLPLDSSHAEAIDRRAGR